MGKLLGILVVLVIIAGAAYYYMNSSASETGDPTKKVDGPVRVEEKYGYTTQTP